MSLTCEKSANTAVSHAEASILLVLKMPGVFCTLDWSTHEYDNKHCLVNFSVPC